MSTGAVLGIVIAGVVVLGALMLFTTARRRDENRAVGRLSRETRSRNRSAATATGVLGELEAQAPMTGREVERAAALERHEGRRVVLPATTEPPRPPAVPLDEETLGVTRRQFLNRGVVTLFTLGLASFGGSMLAFLWPTLSGGFGTKIRAGSLDDILAQIADKKEPYYIAEGRFYLNPYPKEAVPKAKKISAYAAVVRWIRGRCGRALPEVRALGLSRPVVRDVAVVRMPVPRIAVQPGRREEGWSRAARPRPLRRDGRRRHRQRRHQGRSSSGPPIGTNTTGQEAEGPHCV